MPTQRVYVMLVLCTVLLFSCNNKKEKSNVESTATAAFDTVRVSPEQPTDITGYNNAFVKNSTQTFTALPQEISIIKTAKGLKLTVDPDALEKEDGSTVDGKITISIIELTTSEDLFKSNAATVSNGQLLVSGGSYFIGMDCNGQKLRIKKGNSLQVDFPKIKNNEMELFYGNRDAAGNMNWIRAEQPLSFDAQGNYTAYTPPYPDSVIYKKKTSRSNYQLYNSVNSKVIFSGKEMTIKEMVDILQKRGIDKNIDSVELNWANACISGSNIDNYRGEKYRYRMYRIISCKDYDAEKDSLAKEEKIKAKYVAANNKYREEWDRRNEENSLSYQLQNYYSPAAVKKLGWINCDRFYENPQNTEVPVELPITFNNPVIEYFIIYKSFNGLLSGKLNISGKQKPVLPNLQAGEAVTLIAFTKNNGQLFQCREDFVVGKDKLLQLNFKNISAEEMSKMFGKNVRI